MLRSNDDTNRRRRTLTVLGLGAAAALWGLAMPVLAAGPAEEAIDWTQMAIRLFGGLALFLFGMEQMGDALKVVAGDKLRDILGKLTTSRVMGMVTGTAVTAIIQSSSVTTVMLVGFVSANLMSLTQAIGVILGANMGSTITAQILAFPVTKYALILVTGGFFAMFIGKRDRIKQYGVLVMGLGMIFYGMTVMSSAMEPLRSYQPFIELMREVSNPLLGIALGAAFTALVQSSAALVGVALVLASQGLVSLEGGIALALGANIGTCATAGLAAIGKSREAVRVAVAHVVFNISGVLIIVWFVPYFADFVRLVSPARADLPGLQRLAAETPRQIANAHTLFNLGAALLFLPMASWFARLCEWLVPARPITESEARSRRFLPKFLDEVLLDTPALALERARLEIGRMGDKVAHMFDAFLVPSFEHDQTRLDEIEAMDLEIDALYDFVIGYLRKIGEREMAPEETEDLLRLMQAANQVEQMGDLVEINLVQLGKRMAGEEVEISEFTKQLLRDYHDRVGDALEGAVEALRVGDQDRAREVRRMKADMAKRSNDTVIHTMRRLSAEEPNRLQTYTREMELLENLNRIFRLSRRLAKLVLSAPAESDDETAEVA